MRATAGTQGPAHGPLPHGTEVITRVDLIVGERRVPQGAVGRVTKVDGDALDVNRDQNQNLTVGKVSGRRTRS